MIYEKIKPSKKIDERRRNIGFCLADRDISYGMIYICYTIKRQTTKYHGRYKLLYI